VRSYFRGLAHYRLAQVLAVSKKSQARSAIDDCGEEVDNAVDALPKVPTGQDEPDEARHQRTEAYVLGTACTLAGREMSSIPFGGGRIGSRIDEAIKLEPRNPRVRLVEALVAYDRAGKDANAKAAAVEKLRAVTVMFESGTRWRIHDAGVGAPPRPTPSLAAHCWISATWSAAREAIERALLIAPDYAYARRLATQITPSRARRCFSSPASIHA
jgi:hypothetical protein